MTNIILCGGSGTRLWPLSRTLMPKQFVTLFEGESLFQKTVRRNQRGCADQCIVSNAEQYFLAIDQIEALSLANQTDRYLLEPVGRNTAPAIALACLGLQPETIVLVTPSDHLIRDEARYEAVLKKAEALAGEGHLVTFGITPQFAETGYGYIEAAAAANGEGGMDVLRFHEKPDPATAERYLRQNELARAQPALAQFFWNSGMFCFKAGVFLEELQRFTPAIYEASEHAFHHAKKETMTAGTGSADGRQLIRIGQREMAAIPEDSIDYAVMEKSKKVKVIPADIGWSDLGSFDALYDALPHDGDANALLQADGAGGAVSINAAGNLVVSEKLVAAVDVDDLLIVDTADALLVTKRGSSQKVKAVVKALKDRGSELPDIHVTAHRPWGTYTILDESNGYKVKRIVVKPGRRLSLQKHYHRSEHWIVVSGTATVTRGSDVFLVRANESTYIPMGELHRLENVGKIPLVMIEAQVGEYVGEDDIVRIDDDFMRS